VHEGGSGVGDLIEAVVEQTGYLAELRASQDPQDETRVENLSELVASAASSDESEPAGHLEAFLERVSLVADADEIPDGSDASPRTNGVGDPDDAAHGQGPGVPRGLPHRLEDGHLNSHLRAPVPQELEEERRLAYLTIYSSPPTIFFFLLLRQSA